MNILQFIALSIAAVTAFIFLRLGTNNFQKGCFKRGIRFGNGTADIRVFVVAVTIIVMMIIKG